MADSDHAVGIAGSTPFIETIGALVVIAGLGLAALRFSGGTPPERGAEGAIGAIALGAAVAVPGVLAMLSVRDRPVLLLPAAIVLGPLSFLSFALVTLPLLIPAVMLLIAYGRRSAGRPPAIGAAVGTILVVLLLLAGAVRVLFLHDDPRTDATATGGGSTSDVITYTESILSLALSSAAVAAGWFLARPRGDRVRSGQESNDGVHSATASRSGRPTR